MTSALDRGKSVVPLAALVSAFLAASCWQPAFDPELSASTLTSAKMDLVSTITVTGMNEYRSAPGIFLPRRVAEPIDGIWLHGDAPAPYEFESTTAWYIGATSTGSLFDDWNNGVHFAANPSSPPVARMSPMLLETAPLEIVVAAPLFEFNTWAAARLYQHENNPVAMAADTASPRLPAPSKLLGAGMTSETAVSDTMCLVYFEASLAAWQLGEIPVPNTPPAVITSQPLTMPVGFDAALFRGIGFAARKGADYYLSVTNEAGVTTVFRWVGGPAAEPDELAGVTAPLVAILNAAPGGKPTLLSSDGMTMTAYDEDGTELYSFPGGSLRFVHERWDDVELEWMAVFCRTIFIRDQNDDNGTLRTEVFEIPVSNLSSLEP